MEASVLHDIIFGGGRGGRRGQGGRRSGFPVFSHRHDESFGQIA